MTGDWSALHYRRRSIKEGVFPHRHADGCPLKSGGERLESGSTLGLRAASDAMERGRRVCIHQRRTGSCSALGNIYRVDRQFEQRCGRRLRGFFGSRLAISVHSLLDEMMDPQRRSKVCAMNTGRDVRISLRRLFIGENEPVFHKRRVAKVCEPSLSDPRVLQ